MASANASAQIALAVKGTLDGYNLPRTSLGCIFLSSGKLILDKKTIPARIPEDFFPVFSGGILSQERGYGGGCRNSCFLPLPQEFFAGIPVGQEFLYLLRIPPDSSGFLWIPVPTKCCLAQASQQILPQLALLQASSLCRSTLQSPPKPKHVVCVFYSVQYHVSLQLNLNTKILTPLNHPTPHCHLDNPPLAHNT
jgi:hypothetical protein